MMLDFSTLIAILAMAIATALIRLSGLVMMRYVKLSARAQEALTAIPPAVLMAVVAPTALMTGAAETISCAITAFAALRLPLLGATALGVACVALLRFLGF
ncbi:AzlD domain-containing protein [Falsochrobactrum sp. TDYN1]|uniref:AzlD domain-containing protein n=1 Tax=Falsochrobactrum tianjinense TaxID=2706015 RepID=A0A949PL37_9HYPH|nr:AzlD domain-containing protein [Falsochrobactrum sp. TDYN1]MBV2142547.1 AzlD domain-containing protein [Falsochrobactrum sp. TDYN1]